MELPFAAAVTQELIRERDVSDRDVAFFSETLERSESRRGVGDEIIEELLDGLVAVPELDEQVAVRSTSRRKANFVGVTLLAPVVFQLGDDDAADLCHDAATNIQHCLGPPPGKRGDSSQWPAS